MEASGSINRPIKWFARYGDMRIVYVACTTISFFVVGLLWFVIMMLSQSLFPDHQVSSTLFLLGALSGLGALGMSYLVEAHERRAVVASKRPGISPGRIISMMLLAVAYLVMLAAFFCLGM